MSVSNPSTSLVCFRLVLIALTAAICVTSSFSQAQVRGVYPLGMNATNSGVTPEAGFTYANSFLFYSRDEAKGPNGEVLATGNQSVIMDMNTLAWVSKKEIAPLGGAVLSLTATLPIANNSLSSDVSGALSGGGGFADSFYQPFILGWRKERADIRAAYGFLAPTGKFTAGASNNVGSGYWTSVASSGQTLYMNSSRSAAISGFQMYEFHGTQKGTDIHPGQTLSLDYSVTQTLTMSEGFRLQLGLVGYSQWQTTDRAGPNLTPSEAAAHYAVHALGIASNVILPVRKVNFGVKYFREFSNRATFQGYSLQISGAVTL